MNSLEIMIAARALITPPGSWTKGTYARGIDGFIVGVNDPLAVCFCSAGATKRVQGDSDAHVESALIVHIMRKYGSLIAVWNDHAKRTHEEVLAEFDEVIAELEAAQ